LNKKYFPETLGLINQIDRNTEKKLFFFETDIDDSNIHNLILSVYKKYNLTVLFHKTGSGGKHYLSPTIIDIKTWKEAHLQLKEINPKCPMICLRVKPNKYSNEAEYFYRHEIQNNSLDTWDKNSETICNFLNKIFGSKLIGRLEGDLQTVKYHPHISKK
jgi:hypothetical protein